MKRAPYREKIVVCGIIASGKSYVAKMLSEKLGYKYIHLDQVFKDHILPNPDYREDLVKLMGYADFEPFDEDGKYQRDGMLNMMFGAGQVYSNFPVLESVNKLNRKYITCYLDTLDLCWENVVFECASVPDLQVFNNVSCFLLVKGDTLQGMEYTKFPVDEFKYQREHFEDRILNRSPHLLKYSYAIRLSQLRSLKGYFNDSNRFMVPIENMLIHMNNGLFASDANIMAQVEEAILSSRLRYMTGRVLYG